MFRIVAVFVILFTTGCALPTHMQMYQLQGAGKPDQAIKLFEQEYNLETSDAETLLPLCNSLNLMNEYGRFSDCLDAYEAKTDSDFDTSLVETYRAGLYFNLGNFKEAEKWVNKSIENNKNPLPLGPYEWKARLAAKKGNREEALQWIKQLDELKATIFGISIAEDSLGEVKREQKVRIYLELNEPEMAEKTLKTPIPGKSMGEYIFMAAIDYLQTDVDKIANRMADWVAPKGTENWYFMQEVNSLWVYGQVALANQNYHDAIQSFSRMLNLSNINQIRLFYIEGLYYLSKAYAGFGDAEKAAYFADLLNQAITRDAPKIPWPEERESFKNKYSL